MLCSITPKPPKPKIQEHKTVAVVVVVVNVVTDKTPFVISNSPRKKATKMLFETSIDKRLLITAENMYTTAITPPTHNTESTASVNISEKFLLSAVISMLTNSLLS